MMLRERLSDGMKVRVRRALASLGIEIASYTGSFAEHRAHLIEQGRVSTVWDVGAHIGQYGDRLRTHGYHGQIVSIEPALAAFDQLLARSKRESRWAALQVAVSDSAGEGVLNVSANGQSSSLLPIEDQHVRANPASRYVGSQTVRTTTLDLLQRELQPPTPFYVKLDLQGSELPALRGARSVLHDTIACEVELSLTQLYAGADTWGEIVDYLATQGFAIGDVERVCFDPSTKDLLQINALFRQNGLDALHASLENTDPKVKSH
jgi:FkbM family methyltransferase